MTKTDHNRQFEMPLTNTYGATRYRAGPTGTTARLADILRHLMRRDECVRTDAVETLLKPLRGDNPPILYLMQQGTNAVPLGNEEWFATVTGEYRPSRHFSNKVVAESGRLGTGLPAAVQWLTAVWGAGRNEDSVLDDKTMRGTFLAVSTSDAQTFWDFGRIECVGSKAIQDFAQLRTDYTNAKKGQFDWGTKGARLVLGAEVKRTSQVAVAKELDISRNAVQEQLKKAKVTAANPMDVTQKSTGVSPFKNSRWTVK